jgi:hypothetical protein
MTPGLFPKIIILTFTVFGIHSFVGAQTKRSPAPASSPEAVREVDFCEIVKQPGRFFDQTVRITSTWQQGDEFSYLHDDRCPSKASHEIAVSFAAQKDEVTKTNIAKLIEREYGGQATLPRSGFCETLVSTTDIFATGLRLTASKTSSM